jgi:hypothetical protein
MAPSERLHNIYSKIDGGLPLVASSLECPIKNRHLAGAASRAVTLARQRGLLVPPVECSLCGARGRIQGHHDDYAEPLAVRWLCRTCHVQYHTFLRRIFPELKPRPGVRSVVTRPSVTPVFDVNDRATWSMVLSIANVSELYGRSVKAIRNECGQGRFIPAPFLNQPMRWRKADVLRHVEGARGSSLRAVSR